jgi:ABC-2 type transport system ATP-binding protein
MNSLAPSPDPVTAIDVCQLSKQFAKAPQPALADVSLQVRHGTITGLVGPDGAGKTTLLRILAGLLTPSSGSVRVAGIDPFATAQSQSSNLHEQVGYMPQKFGLYEDLTVAENLALYADLRQVLGQERKERLERLLAFTDLARFTDRYAGKLSGGMKQKLGLACTLLGRPQILLLDEPGVGVDPLSRRELWAMVRELTQQGMTVLWSTAYLDEAELCDEVLLLSQGQLLASGTPQVLKAPMQGRCWNMTHLGTARRPLLQRALRLPEVMDGVIQGKEIRLMLREGAKCPDLVALQAGEQAAYRAAEPRLEDAFISLLGGGPGGDSVLAELMPDLHSNNGQDTAPVIEAHQLTKRFGDFVATDRVSFSVQRGEIFGLLGPNGAGKSTTFKMECGLLKPSEGQALVMGYSLKKSPSQARQQLGYMAQKFALYAQLTVAQNLQFFSGIYGLQGNKQQKKMAQMVEAFDLAPYLESLAESLPLGYKQRLALACAVMHEPPVLFLDEPTSGVDPVTRREFWTHINGLADKGVTIMVTTHFMDEAEYCDRIALIYRGRTLALGTPDDLKQRVASEALPNPTMEDAFIQLVEEAEL